MNTDVAIHSTLFIGTTLAGVDAYHRGACLTAIGLALVAAVNVAFILGFWGTNDGEN